MLSYNSLIFTSFSASITDADTKLSAFSKRFGLFQKSFADIKNDTKAYKSLLSGIFETGLTSNDISVLKNYSNQVHTLGILLKNGNITQEQYSSNLARLKNGFTGVTTSAQATAIKIDLLEAEFADGRIGMAEYQAKMKALEGEMQTTSVLADVMGTALRTAFNVGLMIVINLLITGIMEMSQAEEKAIENSKEIANKAKEEANALADLRNSYFDTKEAVKNNTKTKEDLTEITNTLLKRLGVELDTVEDLTAEYGNLDNAINQITADNIIDEVLPGLAEGIVAAKKELVKTASDTFDFYDTDSDIVKWLEEWNNNNGNPFNPHTGMFNRRYFLLKDRQTKNPYARDYDEDEAIKAIANDIQIYTQLLSDMNKKNLESSESYSLINNRVELLKEQYKALTDAIDENNSKASESVLLKANGLNKGLPKTFEAYEKYRENVIKLAESEDYVNLFKGTAEDIEKAIAKQLSSDTILSAFEKRFQNINSLTQKALSVNIDSENDIKEYLNSLSDDELDIANQIPEIFEQGLKGATQKIQEWKSNPDNKLTYELGSLNQKFSELKETIDSTLSNQSTIQSAFDKIKEGTSLTSDEVVKLTNLYPELLGKFTKTADGWTIGTDLLVEANKSITESAKTAIEAEKALLQGKIDELKDKLNFENIESLNPDLSKIQALTDELNKAEQEMSGWDNLLKMLGLDVSDTKEKINAFDKAIEDSTKSISLIKTAMEEMSNDGHISASTYQALVEKGEDYVACLELVDGKLTLNITKLKELEEQELRNIISKNNLRISELEAQKAHGGTAEVIDKETQALARQNAVLEQQIQDVWSTTGDSGSGSSSDPTKDAYTEKQKELKHLLEMEKITQKQYYEMLFGSDEYKDLLADRAKYRDELNSIDEEYYKYQQNLYKENADKQFDDLDDQYKRGIITAEQYAQGLHDLGQELYGEGSIYGGTEFAIKALEELDKKVKETSEDIYDEFKEGLSADGDKTLFNILSDAEELWNKTNELFAGDLTSIKSNAKDIFGTVSSALEDALKKGIITVDGYESLLRSWGNTLQMTEADITDALVDTYEYRADALQKANDGSLASERKYIADMKSLNFSTYGDEDSDFYDPTTYASNLRDITDHQLDVLEKALNDGEISVQEYANSVVEIFKDADVLGADYVSEKLDDIDKIRAEREKTYWEQQKELMEDYYDKQIKEIEDTQKAKEKENKLEELHLKLIKARQTLEEAKNNRNQLVFHDGTFEYIADQDAIMSAEEEVANTLKEIEDEKLQAQIDLLEEQKDAALGFYDQILDEIDFYLNKTLPLSESDQEELAKIRNSDYAQYARDKRDGNLTVNSDNEKIAEDVLNQTDIAEETKQSVSDIAKNVIDIAKVVANGFNFENLVRALGGNPTAEAVKNFQDSYNATLVGKQIVPSTLPSNVTNNSSTTNNATKVINVGGITVKLELTVQSLDDFVNNKIDMAMTKLGNAIEQEMPKIIAKA